MLEFFKADPQHFDLIFVANATAAIKLVADGMRGTCNSGENVGFWYGYHAAAHTSLVGLREVAAAGSRCFISDEEVENWLSGAQRRSAPDTPDRLKTQSGLFAYPAQSNMNGRRLPLDWPRRLRASPRSEHQNVYSLLDAAAYVTTAQLDLSDHQGAPDFVALSFHKIFGFPDLGALIVRRDVGHVLCQRGYFGGGTVDMVVNGVRGESWHANKIGSLHDALEDGTPAFHSILALEPALEVHRKLYRDMASISEHTRRLSHNLYESMCKLSHGNGVALCRIYRDPASRYGDIKSQGPTIAFNLLTSTREWVRKSHVEQLAIVNGIQLRTGGVCNPGGVAWALDLTDQEMRDNYAEGLRCGNGVDEMNGKPTGIIRVSLGAMSSTNEIRALLSFLQLFIEDEKEKPGTPGGTYEKGTERATGTERVTGTPPAAKSPIGSESMKTEAAMMQWQELIKESGDLQQECSRYTCPVAVCRAVTQSEEELLIHFQVHKRSRLHKSQIRGPVRSKPGIKPDGSLRTALKQLGHMLFHE